MLARAGAGLACVGASLLVLGLFVQLSPPLTRALTLLGLITVGILAPLSGAGAQLLALWAALIFPIFALAWSGLGDSTRRASGADALFQSRNSDWKRASAPLILQQSSKPDWKRAQALRATIPLTRRDATLAATRVLLRATLWASAGGLVVAALLNSWKFETKVSDFVGTKAAGVLPMALVALLLLGEFWPGTDARRGWKRARKRLALLGRRAFPLRDVLILALAIITVGVWLARSGNDSGVAVSDFEWKFRATLETIFVARPRTKEFLLCHPALITGALCLLARQRRWAWPLLLLGIIGQISVVNSFAQANNPLYIPFWRTVLALFLGLGFGALMSWIAARRLGFLRDQTRWRGWPALRRLALATSALALIIWGARGLILRRRYAQLTAPSQNTTWPWPGAKTENLRRGVTHWASALDDGTTLDLLRFDFAANPRLKLGLWDSDLQSSPDKNKPLNRFAYWRDGVAAQGAAMNQQGDLIACWNAGFFGLLNRKPREADRAFHLSPVVVDGRAYYPGVTHRWTWGAQTRDGTPHFKLEHQPEFGELSRDYDAATGTLQALLLNGKPLELRPYP